VSVSKRSLRNISIHLEAEGRRGFRRYVTAYSRDCRFSAKYGGTNYVLIKLSNCAPLPVSLSDLSAGIIGDSEGERCSVSWSA